MGIEWGIKQGAKLKELRLKKGFSQEYVAKKVGRTDASIGNYETGKYSPNAKVLHDMAFLYNVTVEEIMGESAPVANLPYIEPKQNGDIDKAVKRACERITSPIGLSQKTGRLLEMISRLTGKTEQEVLDIAVREYAILNFDWTKAVEKFCIDEETTQE